MAFQCIRPWICQAWPIRLDNDIASAYVKVSPPANRTAVSMYSPTIRGCNPLGLQLAWTVTSAPVPFHAHFLFFFCFLKGGLKWPIIMKSYFFTHEVSTRLFTLFCNALFSMNFLHGDRWRVYRRSCWWTEYSLIMSCLNICFSFCLWTETNTIKKFAELQSLT